MIQKIDVKIKKLNQNAIVPSYGTDYAAGADLYACIDSPLTINPNETKFVPTGISMQIPEGLVGLIYARSGLACKRSLAPANKVGVIDSDYRGEIIVALHNHSTEPQTIDVSERIAQIIFTPYFKATLDVVDELDETNRGGGGFGSTGRK